MNTVELIERKRDGGVLGATEIDSLVQGFTSGEIPDYQMAAFLMAVYFRGMSDEETAQLTMAMARSGEMLDLSAIEGIKVDKHSTGGVGDKTTFIVVPVVAACGAPVAKMSGRSLGHTGGTLDKLESIPGIRVELERSEFISQVRRTGAAIAGQTGNLTPADKKLYALRDVTATVDSIPLIAASVMSKKLAAGADRFVLDVKVGRAAFMQSLSEAGELARRMVDIARRAGREAVALLTAMDQPLGRSVGNALEVREAVAALRGEGPADLLEVSLALAAEMLRLAGKAEGLDEARAMAERALESGAALERFAAIVESQGGDPRVVDDPDLLPRAPAPVPVPAPKRGWVRAVDGLEIGRVARLLGAGRLVKGGEVDLAAGVVLHRKTGEFVEEGEPLCTLHARDTARAESLIAKARSAFSLGEEPPAPAALLLGRAASEA